MTKRQLLEKKAEKQLELKKWEAKCDKRVNHILHLLLTFLTAGIWMIVWIILIMNVDTRCIGGKKQKELMLDIAEIDYELAKVTK